MFYKTEYYGVVDTHKKWNKLKGDILSDLGLGDLNLVKQKIDKREQKKEADAKARKKAAEKRKADAKSRAKAAKKKREARRKSLIDKYGKDTGEKIFNKELFIDMTKEMLIEALGNPSDIKETVTREKTTNKYYYHPRETRQSTTVYGLEVTLENDVVSGWKDLE